MKRAEIGKIHYMVSALLLSVGFATAIQEPDFEKLARQKELANLKGHNSVVFLLLKGETQESEYGSQTLADLGDRFRLKLELSGVPGIAKSDAEWKQQLEDTRNGKSMSGYVDFYPLPPLNGIYFAECSVKFDTKATLLSNGNISRAIIWERSFRIAEESKSALLREFENKVKEKLENFASDWRTVGNPKSK
ncbi:MAG: hypothetical protein KF824_08930 [Fimbriimonadaceae bacterium]|nr:MAG: hypothetical protein KF824_08930 [Fimbriimonadaceae bacterium]